MKPLQPKQSPFQKTQVFLVALAITLTAYAAGCAKTVSQAPENTTPATNQTKMVNSIRGGQEAGETNEANEQGEAAEADESAAQGIPKSLSTVAEQGEDIFDSAQGSDWSKAATQITTLKTAAKQLPNEVKLSSTDSSELNSTINKLDQAVAQKDKLKAMENANKITGITARATDQFQPTIPAAISTLDYEGRQLQLGATEKDTTKLKAATREIDSTWQAIQPSVISHGGQTEAQQFNQLIAEANKATTPQQYQTAAQRILDQVDVLENVYTKPHQ